MSSLPVSTFADGICHALRDAKGFPGGIVTDQLVKRPVPEHDGRIAEPIIECVAPDLAMPQRVIAPANEGNRRGFVVCH